MTASGTVRLLLLGDTHLGFDLPRRTRVERPRRGEDLFANFLRALAPARRGEVDLVIHGGDLFFRSRIGAALATRAFAPLLELAAAGLPVIVVPGNHERGTMPRGLLARHENLYIFDRPRTVSLDVRGVRLAISGFPSCRDTIRADFADRLRQTGYTQVDAEIRLLCMHQTVEGATVGPSDYTFRGGADVIAAAQLPRDFAAILCGHIHRHQVLTRDLRGAELPAPVFYAGSTERTSSAERNETKGFLLLELGAGPVGGRVAGWRFEALPARPMHDLAIDVRARGVDEVRDELVRHLTALAPNTIVRLRLHGEPSTEVASLFRAASLRALAPREMIVNVRGEWLERRRRGARRR